MAEIAAAGLASSIVTFIDVSARVLHRLRQYHAAAHDAPGVFDDTAKQLELIVDILQRTKRECETSDAAAASGPAADAADADADAAAARKRLAGVVDVCCKHVDALGALIEKLGPAAGDSKARRTGKAIASVWRDSDVLAAQRQLDRSMQVLALYFSQRPATAAAAAGPAASATTAERADDPLAGGLFDVPQRRVHHMVQRPALLDAITKALQGDATPRVAVLRGLGGQGKTQLALDYCARSRAAKKYDIVLWLDASSPDSLSRALESAAAKMAPPRRVLGDAEAKKAFVIETLARRQTPWLMVFDNFDQPGDFPDITSCFPQAARGTVLITSRHAASERLGNAVLVTGMSEEEASELLLRQSKAEQNDGNRGAAAEIVRRLGYLPLAIDQAAAYVSSRGVPLAEFLALFDERREDVLQHTPELWEYRRKLGSENDETKLSVFTTWDLSFQQLRRSDAERELIRDFLMVATFYDITRLDEGIFARGIVMFESSPSWVALFASDGAWDHYKFLEVVVELVNLSLMQAVQAAGPTTSFSLHPLVADWLQMRAGQEYQRYAKEAILLVAGRASDRDYPSLDLESRLGLLAHMDSCLRKCESYLGQPDAWDSSAIQDAALCFAIFYILSAKFVAAESLLFQAMSASERSRGPDHIFTLDVLHNLAYLYRKQWKLSSAESMCQRALERKEKALEPNHPSTLETMGLLGRIYLYNGKPAEAEDLLLGAVAGHERLNGPKHPSTLACINDLATLYKSQGKFDEAQELFQRALEGYEAAFGPGHPESLPSSHNLGALYIDQGKLAEAEKTLGLALERTETSLGPNHPGTLSTVFFLGQLYYDQGQWTQAEAMLQRLLAGREATLGRDHVEALKAALDLGTLMAKTGRRAEAEPLLQRAVEGLEAALGPSNHFTRLAAARINCLNSRPESARWGLSAFMAKLRAQLRRRSGSDD